MVQVRDLIYREILEYHPHMLADYLSASQAGANFLYPSAVDNFRRQFAHLEAGGTGKAPAGNLGQATSLPRERIKEFQHEAARYMTGPYTASAGMLPQPQLQPQQHPGPGQVRCAATHLGPGLDQMLCDAVMIASIATSHVSLYLGS